MSVPGIPPPEPSWPPPLSAPGRPQGLGGCVVAFLVLVGIILLLPGLCSLVFIVSFGGGGDSWLGLLWVVSFVVAASGILLIRFAFRNR
jgi:hypothetical protein